MKTLESETMAKLRNATKLGTAGLIVLGLIAIALSAAALLQHRGGVAEPAPAESPSATLSPDAPDTETASEPPSEPSASPDGTPNPAPGEAGLTVVVIGDTFSIPQASEIWVDEVVSALGWEVINLSAAGRGYLASPRECELEVCANFGGSISLITESDPDIVVTFGGTADGDNALVDSATRYFETVRDELPDAHLVAISPITTDDAPPYYLRMHSDTISEAVTAVDGVFIDVGQPGVGDGETLSAAAHSEIAELVIEEMSGR